jgi:hypothetical protein
MRNPNRAGISRSAAVRPPTAPQTNQSFMPPPSAPRQMGAMNPGGQMLPQQANPMARQAMMAKALRGQAVGGPGPMPTGPISSPMPMPTGPISTLPGAPSPTGPISGMLPDPISTSPGAPSPQPYPTMPPLTTLPVKPPEQALSPYSPGIGASSPWTAQPYSTTPTRNTTFR